MKREKRRFTDIIKTGIKQGLFFAIGMAAFDYLDKEPFSIVQFIFYFVFFGGSMAYTFRYHYEGSNKKS